MDLVAGQQVRCVEVDNALTKRSLLALQPLVSPSSEARSIRKRLASADTEVSRLGGVHASPRVRFVVQRSKGAAAVQGRRNLSPEERQV
jgi:hypothetical protein